MGLTALLAAAVMPLGAAQAGPAEFTVETACDDRFLGATVAVAGRADRTFAFRLPAPAP
jgi:hypothetical protein